ncbi:MULTISPECIES: adenylosuccinate synthase [unclassified Pseudodesulfovibrio]|uniref:adenylosuccinate synthase n=1 Tax=unclassified Pseudodesulfovibrio TaxID=2661612 RepID=UPI000FEBC90A|nr:MULTISPECIES: adenylosuccinate synthase [unclassified Pseudodesulfovibrio]MCJ2165905.1 adenylosuccinate synthase [Pseudodesulfovibrio sp. S3-i]RWU02662.1 adenylosuccinate synthase [Pseudodesulfovibrio sp. S3]
MSNIVVFGSQWGDEGKGKIVDMLAEKADAIVRFQGGNNAGHTLVVDGEQCILHLIPSGVLHPGKQCLIGNGVVLDPVVFCQELDKLDAKGLDVSPARMMISKKTHVIMPYHQLMDKVRESSKSKDGKIGTTGRGIGPCYEDKMNRCGIRAGDFADPELLKGKIGKALEEKNVLFQHLYGAKPMDAQTVFDEVMPVAERLVPYLGDVSSAIQAADCVLFEGAQGTHLDIDHGTYPFVTSSNTVTANAASGSGCSPRELDRIIAIVKAYTTRVGSGPFPTEQLDADGEYLQSKGHEFGATTGRKRRCGWLDLVVLRESTRLNGPTELAITKLDVLSGLKEIKLCTAYDYKGERIAYPPQEENGMAYVTPVYEVMPGWDEDISEARSWGDLPVNAVNYLKRIEEISGVKIGIVSVGPDRIQTF